MAVPAMRRQFGLISDLSDQLESDALKYMDSEGIPYKEYDIDESSKGRRDYKKLNGKGVPIILVGDQRMNGFSPKRLLAMLEAARSD